MSHTPGPWHWQEPIDDDKYQIEVVAPSSYSDTGLLYICSIVGGLNDDHANARLIAAAPDLLEACEALTDEDRLNEFVHKAWQWPVEAAIDFLYDIFPELPAAIAKAKGEA